MRGRRPRKTRQRRKKHFSRRRNAFFRAARGGRAENAEERRGPPGSREKAAGRTGKKHKALRKAQVFVYNMHMAQERFSDEKTEKKIIKKNTCRN